MRRLVAMMIALVPAGANALWEMQSGHNAMDDVDQIRISTEALDALPGSIWSRAPVLQLECSAGKAHLTLRAATTLESNAGSTRSHQVRMRLDGGKPETISATRAANDNGLYLQAPAAIVKRLLKSESLVVEVTPVGHAPSSVTFNVQGLDRWTDQIRKDCGIR